MSTKYKFVSNSAEYFTTSTQAVWIDVFTTEMYNQRLNYLYWNPVTASYVSEPWHWLYSSAIDYFTDKKGQLDLVILDGF